MVTSGAVRGQVQAVWPEVVLDEQGLESRDRDLAMAEVGLEEVHGDVSQQ